MAAATFVTGYNGKVRTRQELLKWDQFTGLDPEFARRFLALMDASNRAGRPVSIGGSLRTVLGQERLFYSRHVEVKSGGCCTYKGKRYSLRPDAAHAAPPGKSYHEPVVPSTMPTRCLAIDAIGDLKWLADNCAAYGLKQFEDIGNEPWHVQPIGIPNGRAQYRPTLHEPLKPWDLPTDKPKPQPVKIVAPKSTIRRDAKNNKAEVRSLQTLQNFWGWRDALNRTLIVDGDYGQKSEQATMVMQTALGVKADGVYGPVTEAKLQSFLDMMSAI